MSARAQVVVAALLLCSTACHDRGAFEPATVSRRLTDAGFVVTVGAAPADLAGRAGVVAVSCVDAKDGPAVTTFCVVQCSSERACSAVYGGTHESFGSWQRGASLLIQERCAATPAGPTSVDCGVGRAALGVE